MQTTVRQIHLLETEPVQQNVRDHLAAFARGDFDAWGAALAPDVFSTAANPEEVFLGREAVIAEMHRDFDFAFDEGLEIGMEPLSFLTGLDDDCHAAWSAAPLRYTVNFQKETSSFVLRYTSVLKNIRQGWLIRATHYSLALPEEKILLALTEGHLPTPARVVDGIGAGAKSLVGSFKHQLSNVSMAPISRSAHVIGPFPEEYAEGENAVRALFAKWTSKWGALRLRPDGIRAEFISETMGWVGANVEAVYSYTGQRVTLPLRALVVYQKEHATWAIVHAHFSVGIPDELAE